MSMINQLPFYVVGIPLFTALIIGVLAVAQPKFIRLTGLVGIISGAYASLKLFLAVQQFGTQYYTFGNWPAPYGIEYSVDTLNALMILLIYTVSLLAYVYSLRSVIIEIPSNKHGYYYTLYFLLITGLIGITITGDAFNLYVLYEICALSSYALLASGGKRATLATFYYLLIGTIGACFYLIGVAYLFIKTGTLNMGQIFEYIPSIYFTSSILVAFIFINVGLFIKMALFPLHGWLPNVYTKAPISTTCLLAPLGTKLSIYILIRFYFYVFGPEYVFQVLNIQPFMVWLATLAIIVGSVYAIFHTNYRSTIAFIIVAEIGYIVGGLWIGHPDSIAASIYHILADSLMTLSLFMIAGTVLFYLKSEKTSAFALTFRQLRITSISLVVVFASIVGIPPTSGFFSKVYLIKGAFAMGHYQFIVALLFSSLASLFIFFRLFEAYFYSKPPEPTPSVIKEDRLFTLPMIGVSTGIVLLGVTFNYWFSVISTIIPVGLR